jgi:hypothetical protein
MPCVGDVPELISDALPLASPPSESVGFGQLVLDALGCAPDRFGDLSVGEAVGVETHQLATLRPRP